ncbi:hypothetical protein [Prevotella sp. HUN102]|uniref:hypothetical protein n=1 Tax=Prevotella sp. HUN102 TaxID=1392486 RepID=UPI000A5C66E1|nr:hypothetical protein [Prevotella sp. HUN102]
MSRFGYNVVEDTYRITEPEQQFEIDGEMNGDWQTTISVSIESFDEEDERYYIVRVSED